MFNKHLEFQIMTLQKDLESLERSITDKDKKIEELEKVLQNYKENIKELENKPEVDLSLIEKRLEDLEALQIPDVEKEGKSFFADKMVQKIVYGAVATILMAALATFTGSVPWLS